ncbi:hypothetical protein GCM10023185_07170 [Hymenobacter saemangeumensis]|uniref:DUF669 domain-containing protein n=1 Tax=Hymenobacter saemangeumensis TaxID=1084522 RepID=A0ABP8I2D3_9BACT
MSFLPENYEVPTAGGGDYTKLQAGPNVLRVLSKQPAIGYEYWNDANKPVRCLENPGKAPAGMRKKAPNGGDERVKEFWAMVVYNYDTEKIEIWQVTQVAIKSAIQEYSRHAKYGHPSKYDLTITKTGSGLNTEYSVVADPPEAISAEVLALAKQTPINLQALFDGGNPFEASAAAPAPAPKPAAKPTPAPKPKPQPVPAGTDDDNDLPF